MIVERRGMGYTDSHIMDIYIPVLTIRSSSFGSKSAAGVGSEGGTVARRMAAYKPLFT